MMKRVVLLLVLGVVCISVFGMGKEEQTNLEMKDKDNPETIEERMSLIETHYFGISKIKIIPTNEGSVCKFFIIRKGNSYYDTILDTSLCAQLYQKVTGTETRTFQI